MALNAQRGQTLPVWTFGTLTVLVMLAMMLSYGTNLRYQIEAQNAADAAAQGMLSIQTSQWNQTTAALHASLVEEYRIRYILNDMQQVTAGNGGCNPHADEHDEKSCDAMYLNLRAQYVDAVRRYTNDVALVHRLDSQTETTQVSAIKDALAQYEAGCLTNGADCNFHYSLVDASERQDSYLENVYADCCGFTVGGGTHVTVSNNHAPLRLEIVACRNVTAPIPHVWSFNAPTFAAVGRAAATSIMGTQEFMYVGSIYNPQIPGGSSVFQPAEYPESDDGSPVFNTSDANYRIDFGGNPDNPLNHGNPASTDGKAAFQYVPKDEGLLVATGWWNALSIKPYRGTLTAGVDFTCK